MPCRTTLAVNPLVAGSSPAWAAIWPGSSIGRVRYVSYQFLSPFYRKRKMKVLKYIFSALVILIFVVLISFGLRWVGLEIYRYFGTKEEGIRREIFEETKSYNEAKEQELVKYRYEYETGDDETKAAIRGAIRHAFADYDCSRLDPELKNFVKICRGY